MNKFNILTIFILFLISVAFRIPNNEKIFWVDEYSSTIQAKLVFTQTKNTTDNKWEYIEPNNLITHLLISGSFLLFGMTEWSAAISMVLIGSLIPVLIYISISKILSRNVAITSTLLYLFSYFQITWAQQARGYVIQQLWVLLALFVYYDLITKFTRKKISLFFTICILGLLTHTTFILIIFSIVFHYSIFHKNSLKSVISKPVTYILAVIFLSASYFSSQMEQIYTTITYLFNHLPNNFLYYHSFLWREQTVVTLLAFFGWLFLFFKEKKYELSLLLSIPIGIYILFVSFLFSPYVSRYLLPIFPLLYILAGIAVAEIAQLISKKRSVIFSVIITGFIILNGDKYVIKPKVFYSVNHDMREIALVDYDKVYNVIKTKGHLENGQTAVIDTWPDRLKWYLGENKGFFYIFRWMNEVGLVNGLPKITKYEINESGEKILIKSGNPPIKFIGELSDLQMVLKKYPQGFIWIDDSTLPADVINYVKTNMKQELYLDHYEYDDNPYSIWPATLYSWGFEDTESEPVLQ